MQLAPLTVHRLALVPAAGMSAIALFDAATNAVTGHYSVFSDDSDVRWALVGSSLVHGTAYVALLAVLLLHRYRIDAAGRVARATRWLLVTCLALLAAGFLLVTPFVNPETLPAPVAAPVGIAFMLMLLAAPVLGLAVRRVEPLRPGSLLLVAMLPVLALTLAVSLVAPRLGHPAYLETAMALGVAMLGYRAAARESRQPRTAPVSGALRRS